jgi:hypothetical protein
VFFDEVLAMTWLLDFYHERSGRIAQYAVEAPSPAAARQMGLAALLAEHPPAVQRSRRSLVARAERNEGHDGSGWVLYRIARTDLPVAR